MDSDPLARGARMLGNVWAPGVPVEGAPASRDASPPEGTRDPRAPARDEIAQNEREGEELRRARRSSSLAPRTAAPAASRVTSARRSPLRGELRGSSPSDRLLLLL